MSSLQQYHYAAIQLCDEASELLQGLVGQADNCHPTSATLYKVGHTRHFMLESVVLQLIK